MVILVEEMKKREKNEVDGKRVNIFYIHYFLFWNEIFDALITVKCLSFLTDLLVRGLKRDFLFCFLDLKLELDWRWDQAEGRGKLRKIELRSH